MKKPIVLIVGDGESIEEVISILHTLEEKYPPKNPFLIEFRIHPGSAKDFIQSHKRLHSLIIADVQASTSSELALLVRGQEKRDAKHGKPANIIILAESRMAGGVASSFSRFHPIILRKPAHWSDLQENLSDLFQ